MHTATVVEAMLTGYKVEQQGYATHDMEAPQTAQSWETMPVKAREWNKKVEVGEIVNPFAQEHINEPDDYRF